MDVSILVGQTLTAVKQKGDEAITFVTDTGDEYTMEHRQDCCETVLIEDINGDLQDLVGAPIVIAEERTSTQHPEDIDPARVMRDESFLWTFYTFATVKGYVTIRWYGTSNGYYSESVDFELTKVSPVGVSPLDRPTRGRSRKRANRWC